MDFSLNKLILVFLITELLTSCTGDQFDSKYNIRSLGIPFKVEHYQHSENAPIQYNDSATFIITDNTELKSVIDEISLADNSEPCKSAGWNTIRIHYTDTILNIKTDNRKIGLYGDGTFYDLGKDNFIVRRMNKK